MIISLNKRVVYPYDKLCTILLTILTTACQDKWLDEDCLPLNKAKDVAICVRWGDDKPASIPPKMRFNIMSLKPDMHSHGVDEIPSDGQYKTIKLPTDYHGIAFCYDYEYNNYRFDAQQSMDVRATAPRLNSLTYEQYIHPHVSPHEETVADLPPFYIGLIPEFEVPKDAEKTELVFEPTNVLRRYSFIIRHVKGTRYISRMRGAITGMAATYQLATGTCTETASTILFQNEIIITSDADGGTENGSIAGGFYAFGVINSSSAPHYFTIELETEGGLYYYYTWDVTLQMNNAKDSLPFGSGENRSNTLETDFDFDIVIDNASMTNTIGGGNANGAFSDTNPPKGDGTIALPPIERGKNHSDPKNGNENHGGGFRMGIGDWEEIKWNLN